MVVEKFLVESDLTALQAAVVAIESDTEDRAKERRMIDAVFGSNFDDVRCEAIRQANDKMRQQLQADADDHHSKVDILQNQLHEVKEELKQHRENTKRREMEADRSGTMEDLIADNDGINCLLHISEQEYEKLKCFHDRLSTKHTELSQSYDNLLEQHQAVVSDAEGILEEMSTGTVRLHTATQHQQHLATAQQSAIGETRHRISSVLASLAGREQAATAKRRELDAERTAFYVGE